MVVVQDSAFNTDGTITGWEKNYTNQTDQAYISYDGGYNWQTYGPARGYESVNQQNHGLHRDFWN